ncbi:MAG: dimethylsulfonioproprionate lyase family protein [Hyphomicrobiaceae bacterium]
MTPGARWRLDGGAWFDVSPGDLILHEPWQTHAMWTAAEPMLAFACWTEPGDRRAIDWSGGHNS